MQGRGAEVRIQTSNVTLIRRIIYSSFIYIRSYMVLHLNYGRLMIPLDPYYSIHARMNNTTMYFFSL